MENKQIMELFIFAVEIWCGIHKLPIQEVTHCVRGVTAHQARVTCDSPRGKERYELMYRKTAKFGELQGASIRPVLSVPAV
jgi:hypothetical protein